MIYKFYITGFNVTVIDQGTKWVVRDISWIYIGRNPNHVYASVSGTTPLAYDPAQTDFVPVEEVSQELLTQWLFGVLDPEFLRHAKESIDGTILRNARIVNNEQQMTTWLSMAAPGIVPVDDEVLNANLSR